MTSEFNIINKYLSPLSAPEVGAFGLTDDAAVINPTNNKSLILTKDAIVEDVHFLAGTSPENIAHRLIGSNLSDISAMGAKPTYYMIAAFLNNSVDEAWIKEFTETLAKYNQKYNISLIGGDTVKTNNSLSFSLTMFGEIEKNNELRRNGAQDGDAIFVSGTIGDAALGLKSLIGEITTTESSKIFLENRYYIPQPRISLGNKLLGIATSAIDISDGLLADLGHICECSNLGANIYKDKIPLSNQTNELSLKNSELFEIIATGGDDYELLFTVRKDDESYINQLSQELDLRLTKIGKMTTKTNKVTLFDKRNDEINFSKQGYIHKI